MLITLISLFILIIGIVIAIYDYYTCCFNDFIVYTGITLRIIGAFATILSILLIISCQCRANIDYQKKLQEADSLKYRIEHSSENVVGNEMLYSEVTMFNNDLRTTKYWASNPWTSWFNNQQIANKIDYIDFKERN